MNNFIFKTYENLTKDELYSILRLRQEVFIIEQQCCYLDADGLDQNSTHLMLFNTKILVAYMRIINKSIIYPQTTFSRILVKHDFRNKGLGRKIINKALNSINNEPVVMSAQLYLEKFYEEFGFKSVGSSFFEDNIPHIKMIKG